MPLVGRSCALQELCLRFAAIPETAADIEERKLVQALGEKPHCRMQLYEISVKCAVTCPAFLQRLTIISRHINWKDRNWVVLGYVADFFEGFAPEHSHVPIAC